ncbi:MAG: hypothetical protein WC253_05230 [Sulfurovaceae bacterium]|nr:hypothetical protein [Sulfurovaceae bacterium]
MNIKFKENTKGISALINGFSVEELNKKVSDCKDGNCSCNCSPEIMEKIENIEVCSHKDGAEIKITGDIKVQNIAPMMEKCFISNDRENSCKA